MASGATLRARLVAAGQLLDGLEGDALVVTARIQATAIVAHLRQMTQALHADTASELAQVALTVNFGACRMMVLDAISSATASERVVDGRRPQQDFIAFLSYLTAPMWAALVDTLVGAASKREMIATFLVTLGCVNPSEPTLKLANSVWMLCAMGIDTCRTTAADQKGRWLEEFKETLRRAKAQHNQQPSVFIKKLPPTVDDFRKHYPTMHSTVFAEVGPVPPRINSAHLSEIQASYGCRNNGKFAAAPSSAVARATADGTSGGVLMSAMQSMLLMMQQAQQQNPPRHSEREIELTYKPRVSTGPEMAVRGLADLAPRREIHAAPRASFRRAITLDEGGLSASPFRASAETTLALRARAERFQNTPPTPTPIGDRPPMGEDVGQQVPPLGKSVPTSLALLNAACEHASKKNSAAKEARVNNKKEDADDKNNGARQGQSIDEMPKPKRLRLRCKTPPPPMPKEPSFHLSNPYVKI